MTFRELAQRRRILFTTSGLPCTSTLYTSGRWRLGLPSAEVRGNAEGVLSLLEAEPANTLINIGCGQGRYDIGFAEQGMRVTGVDTSEVLLAEAHRLAALAGVSVDWRWLDMRHLPSRAEFHRGILIDAFGYFDTPEEDASVLAGITQALRPGGTAMLVVVNGRRLLDTFQHLGREELEGLVIKAERTEQGSWSAARKSEKLMGLRMSVTPGSLSSSASPSLIEPVMRITQTPRSA